jgi:hypothetical protein
MLVYNEQLLNRVFILYVYVRDGLKWSGPARLYRHVHSVKTLQPTDGSISDYLLHPQRKKVLCQHDQRSHCLQ